MNLSPVTPSLNIFKKLTEELSSLLENEGVAVRPYSDPQLVYFRVLTEKQQLETISGLKHFIETATRVMRAGRSVKEAEFFVKTALEYFGLQPHPEFLLRAYDLDVVVEFYSLSGIQLFRTFNYFEFTSYTLEDIYCRQWHDLYERSADLGQKMFVGVEDMVRSEDPQQSMIFGAHTIKERTSLERLEVHCDGVHVAPMCRDGKVVALSSLVACHHPLESTDRQVVLQG